MNVTHPLRWLSCRVLPVAGGAVGAVLGGPLAVAQTPVEPAARLLPARASDTPPKVSRAASPEYGNPAGSAYQVPASIPAPNYANRSPRPAQPPAGEPAKSPGVLNGAMTGVKDLFRGKPAEPTENDTKPWWPTPGRQPTGVRPVPGVVAEPPLPPPGVYAGPPAYRWFGYGSPTPGANPFAPSGQYPKGSANWYTQTGATPGAFPIPVNADRLPVGGVEPPTYAGFSRPSEGTYLAGLQNPSREPQPRGPRPEPIPLERGSGRGVERVVAQTPPPRFDPEPQMPTGGGTLITSTPTPTGPTDPSPGDVNWQPGRAASQPVVATPPPAAPKPTPATAPAPGADEPSWLPALRSVPAGTITPPAVPPTVSMIRGQAPTEERVDEVTLIRSACFGRASAVGVTVLGPKTLHVKLVSPTESDARDAAAVVSRLPELKTYSVTFEASVTR